MRLVTRRRRAPSKEQMRLLEKLFSQVHVSAPLVVIGFCSAVLGASACSFWHYVAVEAGPRILLAGAVAGLIEVRRIARAQRLFVFALFVSALFLSHNVH